MGAAHAANKAGRLAQLGDYEGARRQNFANFDYMLSNCKDDRQLKQVQNFRRNVARFDRTIQSMQHQEVRENVQWSASESASSSGSDDDVSKKAVKKKKKKMKKIKRRERRAKKMAFRSAARSDKASTKMYTAKRRYSYNHDDDESDIDEIISSSPPRKPSSDSLPPFRESTPKKEECVIA